MSQSAILGPVFAMLLLTFSVWLYMFVRRIRFLNASDIEPQDLTASDALARLTPPEVSAPSDNLKNLFELPVLFYALALTLYVTQAVDGVQLAAAWVFVLFRVLHSLVHCTVNLVMLRFSLYLISSLAVWFMAALAAYRHLTT